MHKPQSLAGVGLALSAYVIWGVVPAYFKLLDQLPATEIFFHRILWSLLFTGAAVVLMRRTAKIKTIFCNKTSMLVLAGSAFFIAANWIIFIWASNNHHLIEVSLGYYINPLMNVALGLVFLKESLRRLQWFALALAVVGVLVQVVALGKLPIISLSLATAFGLYGFLRKWVHINSLDGLLIETLLLLVPSALYFWFFTDRISIGAATHQPSIFWLLLLSGPVTSIPLILFAAAVQRLHYSTIGFIQYLAPSIALCLAVFVFDETLVWQKAVTFVFIWLGLIVYSVDSLLWSKKNRRTKILGND